MDVTYFQMKYNLFVQSDWLVMESIFLMTVFFLQIMVMCQMIRKSKSYYEKGSNIIPFSLSRMKSNIRIIDAAVT